jgi:hypothetical protein
MTVRAKKPIPEPTAQTVFPPNLDRDYFADAIQNPFRPQARGFEAVNAWWLAEAALLAYADEAFARQQFERAGLGQVTFVSEAGSQCYLAESRDFVLAVFRGTQVPKPGQATDRIRGLEETIRDFIADADFRLGEWVPDRFVHEGFKRGLDSIWSQLQPRLLEHVRAGRPIWITGHSVGAPLATLAADRSAPPKVSPSSDLRSATRWQWPVPRRRAPDRPPPRHRRAGPVLAFDRPTMGLGDYVHVRTLRFIVGDGRLRDEAGGAESIQGLTREAVRALFTLPLQGRLAALLGIGRGPYDDHAPLYYALRCCNCDVDSLPPVTQ